MSSLHFWSKDGFISVGIFFKQVEMMVVSNADVDSNEGSKKVHNVEEASNTAM